MTAARARLAPRRTPGRAFVAWLPFALAALTGCDSTLDSLGQDPAQSGTPDGAAPAPLSALSGPLTYDNAFRDLLGKIDADIAAKLSTALAQLFHGDPATQAIYLLAH